MKIVGLTDKNEYKGDHHRIKAHNKNYPGIVEVARHPAVKRHLVTDITGRTDSPDKNDVRGTNGPEPVKGWKYIEDPEEFNNEFLYVLVIYDENRKYVGASICPTLANAKQKGIDRTISYPGWTFRIITEKL